MTSITTDGNKSPGFIYICGGAGMGKVSVMGLVTSFDSHRSRLMAYFAHDCYLQIATVQSYKVKMKYWAKLNGCGKPCVCYIHALMPEPYHMITMAR